VAERPARRGGLPQNDGMPGTPTTTGPAGYRQLLDTIVQDALDPAYADAVARRGSSPPRARSATVALLLVGGLAVGLTVGQGRIDAPVAEQTRTALLGDARVRTATVDALSRQVEQLRQEDSRLQDQVLTDSRQGRAVAQQRDDLSAATGETAVAGPGLSVTVDDAPVAPAGRGSAEQRPDASSAAGRVTDRDLQGVVNALWAAGAEAISVGGIRLSPTTSIRTAGQTVLADYRPLIAPYVVLAIGDATAMERLFRLAGLGVLTRFGQQGNPVRVTHRTDLRLPAAAGVDSGAAKVLPPTPRTPTSGPQSPRPQTPRPSPRISGARS
jgi:uncharacterized protein YlxW (UPF0749 family)